MKATPETATRKYDLGFARWVYENIDGGERIPLCMQCGMCSGSCPIGDAMDNGPRKIFMMIRAGKKEEVLSSNTIWNCTQCYNCTVRCPRQIRVTAVLQSLASVAAAEGFAPDKPTAKFSRAFWFTLRWFGRTDERIVTAYYYFSYGLKKGFQLAMANLPIASRMVKAKRMGIGLPHRARGASELRAIVAAAEAIQKKNQG